MFRGPEPQDSGLGEGVRELAGALGQEVALGDGFPEDPC